MSLMRSGLRLKAGVQYAKERVVAAEHGSLFLFLLLFFVLYRQLREVLTMSIVLYCRTHLRSVCYKQCCLLDCTARITTNLPV